MPIAMIGTPVTIQATAKNGTLQKKNSKEIVGSRKRKPAETPHKNYVTADATSEICMRVVSDCGCHHQLGLIIAAVSRERLLRDWSWSMAL